MTEGRGWWCSEGGSSIAATLWEEGWPSLSNISFLLYWSLLVKKYFSHVFMFSCFLFILWNSFTFTAWESRGCFIQRNSNRYFRTWPWVQSYSQSQLFRLNISLEAPFIWSSSFLNKSRCLSQLDYTAHFWKAFVTRCFRAIISDHYPDTFQETFPFPIS